MALNRYMEGMQEAGWHGDPAMVQFCTSVVPALRFGIGVTVLGVAVKSDETMHPVIEQIFGMTIEEQSNAFAEHCRIMLKAVDEARSLLPHFR